ncbi:MAG: putative aminopeptidase YsdC [Firmicutes bacterium ADurb.Bin248]|nr:MAG: putative aminopeptidase YsdC [Firmicutes bacterium ADurb.Bin248]HOG00184.1 M20/M25/M40 family metallo-hydrolase [Clostridia bacterium]HPK15718.1 M20/M25/M40 family metallo-hydrolase [Clostridia bacterium]
MDVFEALSAMTTAPGVTGNEARVSEVVRGYFRAYTDDISVDAVGNTYARIGETGPTLLVMAHMDEVGMMVTCIEDNGMLRVRSVAGVDPRVLPGSEVTVHGKREIRAVIGAKPPHLQDSGDEKKAYTADDLVCDTGLSADEVNALVGVGDNVTFRLEPPMKLKNSIVAGKTFDDRACVAVMLEAMDILKSRRLNCRVVFCGSVQEESGGLGASAGGYNVKPDLAVAIDVCHAPTPGTKPFDTVEMDRVSVTTGANIHPKVFDMIKASAEEQNIPWETDVAIGATGTDAWSLQPLLGGIPCGLISLPLRYMHTSVEVISLDTLRNCAKVIAGVAANLGADWEEKLCLDD